jgi:predicted Zn finger-like uncharacterized protein
MSLVTRCTACDTTFRVLPAQLAARGGRVRCGQCSTVFDGLANLLSADAIAALPGDPAAPSRSTGNTSALRPPDSDSPPELTLESGSAREQVAQPYSLDAQINALSPSKLPAAPEMLDFRQTSEFQETPGYPKPQDSPGTVEALAGPAIPDVPSASDAESTREADSVSLRAGPASAPGLETPGASTEAVDPAAIDTVPAAAATSVPLPGFLAGRKPKPRFTLLWSLLALLALTGLAAQAVYQFRTEIAVLLPQARVHLETACEMLDCEVRLPRRAELVSIESSDLQADPSRAGVIVLNALLRNRAPFPQEFPALELTLTDERDQPIVRRVLAAADYAQDKRGIAGGAEEAVRVFIDTGRLRATGYRLYLFYP